MALKIVDVAEKRVETLNVVLYGKPGTGKTTLALTASKPLLLDFDNGAHRAAGRVGKSGVDVESWADIEEMTAEDVAPFDTIIIDTVGTALDSIAADILARDPKMGVGGYSLSLQGYGMLKGRFRDWLSRMRRMGKHVVMLAHTVEEQRKDGDNVERIEAAGSSKQEVYRVAELYGDIDVNEKGHRILSFDMTTTKLGKNCGIPPQAISLPDRVPDTLATIIKQAISNLNTEADKALEESQHLAALREQVNGYTEVGQFNEHMNRMIETDATKAEKWILVQAAQANGLRHDGEKFVPKEVPGNAD